MISRSILAAIAGALVAIASGADAAWYRASSPHFVIYSDQLPDQLRAYATKLERFDQAVRLARGSGDYTPDPVNRLKLFSVRDVEALQRLYGRTGSGVAGFFIPRAGGSVAFVPIELPQYTKMDISAEAVFFHEYAHQLMYERIDAAYPLWLVEGFAEFFSTAKVQADGSVRLGEPALHRADMLIGNFTPLPLKTMLAPKPGKIGALQFYQTYARGWLLTHYLTFEAKRRGQLDRYVTAIQQGVPPLDAATGAFGDLNKLNSELGSYTRSMNFPAVDIPASRINVGKIDVVALSPGHEAMMPVILRSQRGTDEKAASPIAADARRIAAAFPTDPDVQIALAEAEFDDGKYSAAEAAADRALRARPRFGDAMLYKARAMMAKATKEKDKTVDWRTIRAQILAANRLDPEDPEPLILYADSLTAAGQGLSESAVEGLIYAHRLAPQDMGLRWRAAGALLSLERDKEARVALVPIAFNPHGRESRERAADVLAKLTAGDRKGALALLTTSITIKDGEPKLGHIESKVEPRLPHRHALVSQQFHLVR